MTRQLKFEVCRACFLLITLAFLVRSIPVWSPPLLRLLFPFEQMPSHSISGQAAAPEKPVPQESTPFSGRILPKLRFRDIPAELPDKPPALNPLPEFTAEDADNLIIRGNCTLSYDKAALLLKPLPEYSTTDDPQILIVQSHSTEAFQPEPGWEYEETETCRTLDPEYSVIRLGAEITAVLESYGITVIHDQTINDYPSYSGSYDRMEAIIRSYLDKYPSIRMVLDVHRDAFENTDGSMGGTAENGVAKVMLVTGTNEGGLYHPNWQQNLSFSLKLDALMSQNNPGLSRGISLTTQRYNQHLTSLSLLAEFGAAGDTLQEAIAAARAFAANLAQLLQE